MNEADFVFANEDSLVEAPSVEPLFLGSLSVKSMIPMSHGMRMNDLNNVMCYRNYDMCCVYGLVCCMHNV